MQGQDNRGYQGMEGGEGAGMGGGHEPHHEGERQGGGGYGRGRGGGGRGRGGRGGYGGHGGHGGERRFDDDGRGVPLSELDPALTEVSRKLIGCAIEVHKSLGPGFDKATYLKAVEAELEATGVPFQSGYAVPVIYRGRQIGTRTTDLLIDNKFLADILAQRGEIGNFERSGMRAGLKAADLELGLIINFAERRLKDGLVRVLNAEKLGLNRDGHGSHGAHESSVPQEDQ